VVSWLEFNSAFNTIQAQTESSDCSLGCSVTLVWRGVQCGWWVCMFVCLFVCVSERTVNLVLSKTAFNSAAMIRARHLTCPGWYVCSLSSSTGSANDANPNPNPWCQTPDVSRLVRLFSFILHWQHKRRYLVYSEIGLGFLPPPPLRQHTALISAVCLIGQFCLSGLEVMGVLPRGCISRKIFNVVWN